MSDTATPKTLNPKFEKELRDTVSIGMDEKGIAAIMVVAKAAPDHADDMLKNIKDYVGERTSFSTGFHASDATKRKLMESFTKAAIDGSKQMGGETKDETLVQALATISTYGSPVSADKIRTDLHAAVKDDTTAAGKTQERKDAQAQVDTSTAPDPAAAARLAQKKKEEEEAEDKRAGSQKNLGEDVMGGLLKMLIIGIASMFGFDASKLFDDKKPEQTAPANDPATLAQAEKDGKTRVTATNDKGEKGTQTAATVISFLQSNGVEVASTDNKTEAMWNAVDKLRKENGLEARVGQHDGFNPDDVKMMDKLHADYKAKAGAVLATLDDKQKHALVAETTNHPEVATGGDMSGALAQWRQAHKLNENGQSREALDGLTMTAAVAGYAQANHIDLSKVSQHLNDDVAKITAAATPPRVVAAATVPSK